MVNIKSPEEERLHSRTSSKPIPISNPAFFHNVKKPKDWNGVEDNNDLTNWKREMPVQDFREGNNNTKKNDHAAKQNKRHAIIETPKVEPKDVINLELRLEEVKVAKNQEEESLLEPGKQHNPVNEAGLIQDAALLSFRQAEEERLLGNECFKAKRFKDAVTHYTASIKLCPTAMSYNNRAVSYIRLCKFSAALEDTNNCLNLDPNSTKALYRRSITYQHKNMFREALADMSEVVRREPSHVLALYILEDLKEQCLTLPKTLRFKRYNGPEVLEISSKDSVRLKKLDYKEWYEVNDWGLPKRMCQCNAGASVLTLPRGIIRVQPFQQLCGNEPRMANGSGGSSSLIYASSSSSTSNSTITSCSSTSANSTSKSTTDDFDLYS